jgi:hypothetical protein
MYKFKLSYELNPIEAGAPRTLCGEERDATRQG